MHSGTLFHAVLAAGGLAALVACGGPGPSRASDPSRSRPSTGADAEAMEGSSAKMGLQADMQPASQPAMQPASEAGESSKGGGSSMTEKIVKTDEEWRKELTPAQYRVLREKGTERAFTGEYYETKTPGVYVCAACGEPLFDSKAKFDSGTGWPSFYEPIKSGNVDEESDASLGMVRTEVTCARCGSHLGHVFPDGPPPTGERFCINSIALKLEPVDGGKK